LNAAVAPPLDHIDINTLGSGNRALFEYWLSLRKDGAIPVRTDFNPRRVQRILSSLCLFQVWPGEGVSCRIAGTTIARALDMELTGKNYLEFTPPDFRRERLQRFTQYTTGMISRTIRELDLNSGQRMLVEEITLPFGDMQEDGSMQVVVHVEGKMPDMQTHVVSSDRTLGAPVIFESYAA
jgi:hypothetical protein